MARIPTFADLGFNDPRGTAPLPQYPESDPGAAALVQAGRQTQQLGQTAFAIGGDQEDKRQQLNTATASIDFLNRFIPIHTKIETSNDPEEIAQHRQIYQTMLQESGQAIDNPARRQQWMASHMRTLLLANADADKRVLGIQRDRAKAGILEQIDTATRTASVSPSAAEAGILAIDGVLSAAPAAGIDATDAYRLKKASVDRLVRSTADNLILQGKPEDAVAVLDKYREHVDPIHADVLRRRAESKGVDIDADALAAWSLGKGPQPKPRTPGRGANVSLGGAVPQRIAQAASAQNIDPTTALATAQIESAMGRNLGARGNIFQLGESEWSSVGGGRRGDPDTDIQNGVSFLARTQAQIEGALGRKAAPWEVYLAHQQGVGGATKLLGNPGVPAGELLPPRNISANGGDPSAPASEFVGKWRAKFTQVAANIGRAPTATDALPEPGIVAVGDSIAAHLVRKAGAGGRESGKVGVYNPGDTAVSGYDPSKVLSVISETPDEAISGKNIVLSTGTSNDPDNRYEGSISAQIATLKSKGAASVTVMGVGTAPQLAGRNERLAQIASQNGAAFSGPLRKVASDGIHSNDPRAEFAAVRAALPATGAAPAAREAPPEVQQAPQQTRSGLPPLSESWKRIWDSPFSDDAKQRAWSRAHSEHTAVEASIAQQERLDLQKRKVQDEAIEGEIIADLASPDPQWNAAKIMSDRRLSPDARMRMVNFAASVVKRSNDKDAGTYGPGFYRAFQDIHRAPGDPNKITSPEDLYDRIGPEGDLTIAGLEKLRSEIFAKRTPEGEAASMMKKQFIDNAHKMISGTDPLLHIKDSKGEEQFLRFMAQALPAYEAGLKAGKAPTQMLNPDSPEYLGKAIQQFIRPREQWLKDMLDDADMLPSAVATPAGKSRDPKSFATPDALREAVRTGAITYDAGVAEAQRRGYIPAPPTVPLR